MAHLHRQALIAILWQEAEFVALWVRRGSRGIHPGAHVGTHFILWLGCLADGSFVATIANASCQVMTCFDYIREYPTSSVGLEQAVAALLLILW